MESVSRTENVTNSGETPEEAVGELPPLGTSAGHGGLELGSISNTERGDSDSDISLDLPPLSSQRNGQYTRLNTDEHVIGR